MITLPSRQPGVFTEVGFAFVDVGAVTFFALFGEVVEECGVAGEFLKAGLAVDVGIEGALQTADSEGAVLEDLARPLFTFSIKIGDGHDLVHEAHFLGFFGVVLTA